MPVVGHVPWLRDRGLKATVLGGSALLLGLLVLTGAVLWWPGIKGFLRKALTLRLRRNAAIRSYDLHRAIGIAALPLLALFALTAANFQFGDQIGAAYGLVTRAPVPPPWPRVASTPGTGAGIDAAAALRAVEAAQPTGRIVSLAPPRGTAGTWSAWVAKGLDDHGRSVAPGNVLVQVDRWSGAILFDSARDTDTNVRQSIYEDWFPSLHRAQALSGWWKLLWLLGGLAPLALAITGTTIVLLRRRARRRARRRKGGAVEQTA